MILTNTIITFYCACKLCCGAEAKGITASGNVPREGITIAAGNRNIPLGSKVVIDNKVFTVQDRMHKKYDGENRFDVYVNKHNVAKQKGIIRNKKVRIIK